MTMAGSVVETRAMALSLSPIFQSRRAVIWSRFPGILAPTRLSPHDDQKSLTLGGTLFGCHYHCL